MAELANCSRCGAVFAKRIHDICHNCYRAEEADFDTVYRFLTKQKNREATLMEIVAATDVEEEIIIKFIREKRLRSSEFPKLAYPCEACGTDIVSGKICGACSGKLLKELEQFEEVEQISETNKSLHKKQSNIYYVIDKNRKNT